MIWKSRSEPFARWKELGEAGQNVRKLLKDGGRACKPDSVRRADVNVGTLRRSFL